MGRSRTSTKSQTMPSNCATFFTKHLWYLWFLSHGFAVSRNTAPQKEKVCCIFWGIGIENIDFFWTGHNPSHQESMDHLPLAAGPGHLQTLPTMLSLGLPRIPRKTSTSNLKSQQSKSQNLIQAKKKQLNSSESQLNEPNSPNSWIHVLGICISPLPVYESCKRRLLWINRVQNTVKICRKAENDKA